MSTIHIDELNPKTCARVLEQLSGTTALATIEDNNHSSTYTPAEMRARSILSRIDSISAKLKTLESDIRLLWIDFDNLKADETILGCATKKEFCEKKLHRTPRAIQYMLSGGNPNNADRSEIISLPQASEPIVEIPTPNPVTCTCPDCGQPFPSRNQLKKHGQSEHNIPTSGITEFFRRADFSEQMLNTISGRILARDGADQDYTLDENEPLGWKNRNTVRVRITTLIHNMEDRRCFWFELSGRLWAQGWRGNTVFRDGRREAWIFHWKTEWVGDSEMPEDWSPVTDGAPVEPETPASPPVIDVEFVDVPQPEPAPAEPESPTPVELQPTHLPKPKPQRTLEDVLDKLVERIALQPYGYYAAKFAKYPEQHITDLAAIELAKQEIWQRIVEIGQEKLALRASLRNIG